MGRGRGRRDNELIGQTVRISQGPYKGEKRGDRDPVSVAVTEALGISVFASVSQDTSV